jgi:hypothetical protein
MMSLPSRVVISLTFLTDSAEMRALPILIRGLCRSAPRHSVACPAAFQIMFKNNEEFSIFELLRDVFSKRFHGGTLRRLNNNG